MCEHLLEGECAPQTVVVVDYIYIVYLVHILGLQAHLLDALGHRPVLVHHYHLGAHEAAGGVFVVFEKIDDIAGLLHVIDVAEDFVAFLLVELLYEVDGIVGIEVVDLLGDFLDGHGVEELQTVILVELHKHVGGFLLVEQLEEVLGLLKVEIAVQLGDVGGVERSELGACLVLVVGLDDLGHAVEVFLGKFFHSQEDLRAASTATLSSTNCSTDSCSGRMAA